MRVKFSKVKAYPVLAKSATNQRFMRLKKKIKFESSWQSEQNVYN